MDRLQAIRDGRYLSLASELSTKSIPGIHNAAERPPLVPRYDPQQSTRVPWRQSFACLNHASSEQTLVQPANIYSIDQQSSKDPEMVEKPLPGHFPRELPPRLSKKQIRSARPMARSQGQYEAKRIPPMHCVELPANRGLDMGPPDGGAVAWRQVFAGFFVVFDAQ